MRSQTIGDGANQNVAQQVDPQHKAARVSLRPVEVGSLGSYSQAFVSGIIAAGMAGAAVIFAWRWTTPDRICRVRRVRLTANTDGTAFAQGSTVFDLIRAQSMQAQYTGGATITLTGKSGALATRFAQTQQLVANSAVGNVAVANTGALSAGTPAPVFDSFPLGALVGGAGANPAIALVPAPGLLLDPTEAGRQYLELLNNEGFAIRGTVPATGTWKFAVEIDWDELDPSKYLGAA